MSKTRQLHYIFLICFFLSAITIGIYWQVNRLDFTDYDDDAYVTLNPDVTGGLDIKELPWAFTSNYCSNWHPLTWISHMADCEMGGLDPAVHHRTSLFFHVANVLLLFLALNKLTGRRWASAFVAALFAVHPLHVESVAWVAERKDVLSTFFFMLTILAYIRYVKAPKIGNYVLIALAFVLGLLSKPMLVSVPFLLILLDIWPLKRTHREQEPVNKKRKYMPDRQPKSLSALFIEKIPLFVLAIASCAVTFFAQRNAGAVQTTESYSIGIRIANALVAYTAYLYKTIWPLDLCCFYPHPGATIPVWITIASSLILLAITIFAVRTIRTRPYFFVGWLWYLITLIPVIGLVQVGWQAMADRYTYIPLIGIFIALTWGIADLIEPMSTHIKNALLVPALLLIAVLSVMTFRQIGYWQNTKTLWTHALEVNSNNAVAHYNLGNYFISIGDDEEAIPHFRKSVEIDPSRLEPHCNLGASLAKTGHIEEALEQLYIAVKIKPDDIDSRCNLAQLLAVQGRFDEAQHNLSIAWENDPNNPTVDQAIRLVSDIQREAHINTSK